MKRASFLLLFFTSLFALAQQDALIAHWALNGGAKDLSVNHYDGTLLGNMTPVKDRFGNAGCALATSDPSSMIQIPQDILIDTAQALSISYWMRIDILKGSQFRYNIFAWNSPVENNQNYIHNFIVIGPNPSLDFNLLINGVGPIWVFRSNEQLHARWLHFVIVFKKPRRDNSNGPVTLPRDIYYEGKLIHQYPGNGYSWDGLLFSKLKQFRLGEFVVYNSKAEDYQLSLDDVRIFNRELGAEEIAQLYNEPNT